MRHQVVAKHMAFAGVGAQQTGENAQRGGLARPVRADEPQHLARLQVEGDIDDRRSVAEALGEATHRQHLARLGGRRRFLSHGPASTRGRTRRRRA